MSASMELDPVPRSKGITTTVLGGFPTNCCVESTMRSGDENGYEVVTLTECVAATSGVGRAGRIDAIVVGEGWSGHRIHVRLRCHHVRVSRRGT